MRQTIRSAYCLVLVASLLILGCESESMKKSKLFLDGGMYKEAIELLRIEIQDSPKNVEARFLLGKAYLLAGDVASAGESFDKVILLDAKFRPKVGDIYLQAGLLKLEKAELSTALGLFKAAKEKDASLGTKIAELLFNRGSQTAQAITEAYSTIPILKSSIEFDPAYGQRVSDFCYERCKALYDKGQTTSAIEFSQCSVDVNPKAHDKEISEILYNISTTFLQKDDFRLFDDTLRRATTISYNEESVKAAAIVLYEKGIEAAKRGETPYFLMAFKKAIALYSSYIKEDGVFLYHLAEYHAKTGNIDQAEVLYEKIGGKYSETEIGRKFSILKKSDKTWVVYFYTNEPVLVLEKWKAGQSIRFSGPSPGDEILRNDPAGGGALFPLRCGVEFTKHADDILIVKYRKGGKLIMTFN